MNTISISMRNRRLFDVLKSPTKNIYFTEDLKKSTRHPKTIMKANPVADYFWMKQASYNLLLS